MATRGKDTAPPGKEKRGVSPSHPIPHHMRSPNSSATNSPVRKRAESTTSNKSVPNYLKPTVSSSGDSNIHNKPTLNRRRSFDKPPLATSPKTANPKERILRPSSSFSGKTSSTLQNLDRLSRTSHMSKDATSKQRGTGTYARSGSIKKITAAGTASKKQEASSTSHNDTHKTRNDQDGHNSSTTKASITDSSHAVADVIPQAETGQDDTCESRNDQDGLDDSTPKASVITDPPHATEDVTNPQAELSEQEDNQELPVTDTESDVILNNNETEDTNAGEDKSAIEDQEEHNGNVSNAEIVAENQEISKMEEPEEEQLVEKTSPHTPQEPEEITNELSEHNLDENTVKVGDETQKEKEEDGGKETVMAKEGEAVQETNTTVASSIPHCQVVQGKKESVVSNDVIEETASKLREQRKNRVKALAGAFETVISLQEPKA
ncbi:hypothetical protein P3L10_031977 [Capsicum annuum]|uniref:uncharacterized protein LOC107851172 n=1 Tax=Capsicum annuum TaxID=4072 RepID=UPI001FB0502D|nr:uncharacterized protein LOC107851172 [Capsicum annuum]